MRISDWSSDVCSSDLALDRDAAQQRLQHTEGVHVDAGGGLIDAGHGGDHQPARQGDQPGHQEHDPAALPQAVEIVEEKLIKLSHASCYGRPCYPGSAWVIPTATPAPSTVAAQGKSTCRGDAQIIILYCAPPLASLSPPGSAVRGCS